MMASQPANETAERALTAEQFRRPLEFILADHERQHCICDDLQGLANESQIGPVTAQARSLLRFLTEDFANHIRDEEEDLFPLLLRRCRPEDGIGEILGQLSSEHELDQDLVDFIIADLERLAGGFRLSNSTRFFNNVRAFAETHRRHLSWENRVVLPLARQRLTADDLAAMGRRMAAHRGLDYPGA
ncbi:MAG: hemerythrin domain-containing protein [Kiloniellales bacterium]